MPDGRSEICRFVARISPCPTVDEYEPVDSIWVGRPALLPDTYSVEIVLAIAKIGKFKVRGIVTDASSPMAFANTHACRLGIGGTGPFLHDNSVRAELKSGGWKPARDGEL